MTTLLRALIGFGLMLELAWMLTIVWLSYDLLWGGLIR
jgi:hypothetical protein